MTPLIDTALNTAVGWVVAAALGGVLVLLGALVRVMRKIPRLLTEMRHVNAVQTAGILASHEAQEASNIAITYLAAALQKMGCNGDTEHAVEYANKGTSAIKKFKDDQAAAALNLKKEA